jgi:hypothetical protein
MDPEQLFTHIVRQQEEDMALLKAKNRDYAGEDPLRNLRTFGFFGVVVRLCDKFNRLENYVTNKGELNVKDETILDTLRDIRNYAHLGEVLFRQENGEKIDGPCRVDWKLDYLRRK